ncbi:MAG: hypothetical protein ACFCVB_18325, partial [Nodosilinea sp.]
MSKTFNLAIPFDFLLQAIAKLSHADKQRLWEFLDTDLHDSTDETLDPEEESVTLKSAEESFRQG